MGAFSEAVEHYQRIFSEQGPSAPDEVAYILAPERPQEAELVDDLVQRFASAELGTEPIGRVVMQGVVPTLGQYLAKQLDRGGDELARGLRRALIRTVARGYLSSTVGEVRAGAGLRLDRRSADIWAFWIPRIYSPFLKEALSERDAATAEALSAQTFKNEIKELGLGRRGQSRQLEMIGMAYFPAGIILRAAQTTQVSDELITNPPPSVQARWPNRWDYARYPP